MDKRREERYEKRLMVKLRYKGASLWGVVNDLSENGMSIKINRSIEIGTDVSLDLVLPQKETSFLQGVVRRSYEVSGPDRRYDLGIEITENDMTYRFFVRSLSGRESPSSQANMYAESALVK